MGSHPSAVLCYGTEVYSEDNQKLREYLESFFPDDDECEDYDFDQLFDKYVELKKADFEAFTYEYYGVDGWIAIVLCINESIRHSEYIGEVDLPTSEEAERYKIQFDELLQSLELKDSDKFEKPCWLLLANYG